MMRWFRADRSITSSVLNEAIAHLRRQLARLGTEACDSAIFSEQAAFRLTAISKELDDLIDGRLTFQSTETWRTVYEAVLSACVTKTYLSVAVVRSEDYWRDQPGQTSLEFNYRLVEHGYFIHRIFLVDEFFWARSVKTPSREVLDWIMAQHDHGVEIGLVRLAELESEPDLVVDMGIYGEQAVGTQQTDLQGRTTRFEICFKPEQVRLAEQRWSQLQLYAVALDELQN